MERVISHLSQPSHLTSLHLYRGVLSEIGCLSRLPVFLHKIHSVIQLGNYWNRFLKTQGILLVSPFLTLTPNETIFSYYCDTPCCGSLYSTSFLSNHTQPPWGQGDGKSLITSNFPCPCSL